MITKQNFINSIDTKETKKECSKGAGSKKGNLSMRECKNGMLRVKRKQSMIFDKSFLDDMDASTFDFQTFPEIMLLSPIVCYLDLPNTKPKPPVSQEDIKDMHKALKRI